MKFWTHPGWRTPPGWRTSWVELVPTSCMACCRSIWCYSCMLLSLIINIFMLITWRPQMSLADLQDYPEDIAFPDALYELVSSYYYYSSSTQHGRWTITGSLFYFLWGLAYSDAISTTLQVGNLCFFWCF